MRPTRALPAMQAQATRTRTTTVELVTAGPNGFALGFAWMMTVATF